MNSTREKLIITRTGQARGLVGPLVDRVTRQLGERDTRRASRVEPTRELTTEASTWLACNRPELVTVPNGQLPKDAWWADMHPCGHALVLGPFATNTEALAAEKAWLLAHDIPTAGN